MNFSQIANKLRYKITKFSGILSQNLDKTASRFVRESIYGIMASQSVMLTEIGRQIESKVSLKKIEERLSRQLMKAEIWKNLHEEVLHLAKDKIKDDTLLVMDLSDIHKKYAEEMEYLAQVRDGSEDGQIVNGYWTNQVIATELDSNEVIPLYCTLYSQKAPDFTSENDQILAAIDIVSNNIGNKGIWVIDRGGDRDELFIPLMRKKRNFIIRLVGTRDLLHQAKLVRSLWLSYTCPCPYKETIVKIKEGKEIVYHIQYGILPVRLPDYSETPLFLVVIKGMGEKPMMLLTSLSVKHSQKDVRKILRSYIKRWSIEETIRFMKQTYDLENIRVLKYERLRNMMAILLSVFYFISVILDRSQKLTIMTGHILKSAKRVFGIPDFRYYALGDGISNIFKHYPGKINILLPIKSSAQLNFHFG